MEGEIEWCVVFPSAPSHHNGVHCFHISCYQAPADLIPYSRLDNDVVVKMKRGDTCIQRGTIHGWTNTSDKPARMYFVLTAAKPIEIKGKQLGDAGFSHEDVASGGKEGSS
jgi:hypothetical protein